MTEPIRKIRLGIVGGGATSYIGETHRYATHFESRYELVTGAFSSNAEQSRDFAATLGIAADRRYGTWQEMAQQEAARADGIEVVSIMTPNDSHYEIAKAFLLKGIHVICDKPLTTRSDDALDLLRITRETGLIFAVTYNYSGYPMVRHARNMIQEGELGEIRMVQVEHASGWAATLLEAQGHKQALWRTTPSIAGKCSVVSDLGGHIHHLARFITGLEIVELSADLQTIVPGRLVDDNAHIMLRFSNGAPGMMWVSMAATGHIHGQRIRVFGEKGSIEWVQEQPNELFFRPIDAPIQILSRGFGYTSLYSRQSSRLWPGHPEGFLGAFANIYTDIADAILAHANGEHINSKYPTVEDGVLVVQFVEAVVSSHEQGAQWVSLSVDLSS